MKPLKLGVTPKLGLIFALFAAALLAGVGALVYNSGRRALEAATIAELQAKALEKEAALNAWVEERREDVTALAASPGLLHDVAALYNPEQAAAHRRLAAELRPHVAADGAYLEFFILEPETGEVMVSTNPAQEGKFKETLPYFLNGRRAPYIQNVYYSIAMQGPAMTAAAPLRSTEGRLLGVLAARLNLDQVNAIIRRRTGLHQSDDAFLVNTANLFVTQPHLLPDPAVLQRGVHTAAVKRCLTRSNGTINAADYRGAPALITYHWLPERQLCLIVKMDQAEALAPIHALGRDIALAGGLALGVASVLGFTLARTITIPIKQLVIKAQKIGSGQLDTRIEIKSGDELEQLAGAFNQMAAELQKTLVSRADLLKEVAERKRAEEKVHQLNLELEQRVVERTAQLEAANKELEAFAYSVSHDLRAPLRGIDGWSLALLEDYYEQLDQTARQYLDRVRFEAQRMGHLIDDMLQLSRLTRADMSQEWVNLSAIAQATATRLQESEPERQVTFILQEELSARGDPHLLEAVLSNLLANAFKFTGKTRRACIEFGQIEIQGERAFFVRDNGAGFDMAYAQKLFGAFQRLHKASDFPGTGIGLATVQRIIHRHGGRVWAEAQVNQGATFYFTLKEII